MWTIKEWIYERGVGGGGGSKWRKHGWTHETDDYLRLQLHQFHGGPRLRNLCKRHFLTSLLSKKYQRISPFSCCLFDKCTSPSSSWLRSQVQAHSRFMDTGTEIRWRAFSRCTKEQSRAAQTIVIQSNPTWGDFGRRSVTSCLCVRAKW